MKYIIGFLLLALTLALVIVSISGPSQSQLEKQLSRAFEIGDVDMAKNCLSQSKKPQDLANKLLLKSIRFINQEPGDKMFKLMIESGADINSMHDGIAVVIEGLVGHEMKPDLLQWCIDNGYDINLADKDNRTVLSICIDELRFDTNLQFEMLRVAIENGADVSFLSKGLPVLEHFVIYFNFPRRKELLKFFIDAGLNLEAKNKSGLTLLQIAINHGDEEMATFLRSYTNPNAVSNGKTNYPFAGNWQGSGSDSQGNDFTFAAKVIDMGDGKFRMLVLDELGTKKKPMYIMDGVLENNKFPHITDNGVYTGGGELTEESFTGYYKGPVDGTYKMHRVK